MVRNRLFWLILTMAVMLLLPWAAVRFIQSDMGMATVFLLFFGIDPAYCVFSGYCAGKQIRPLWWLPLLSAVLFLAGTWLFFEMGEIAFLLYAGMDFLLGTAAMLVSLHLEKRRKDHG